MLDCELVLYLELGRLTAQFKSSVSLVLSTRRVRLFSFSFEDWNFNLDTKLTIQVGDESRSSLRAAVNIQQSMDSQDP
jgi:hypothetical protein